MPIKVLKVSTGPIYSPQDLPTMPQKYTKPVLEQPAEGISSRQEEDDDGQFFTCSPKVLQALCEGRDLNSIPQEIQAMVAGVKRPRLSKEVLLAFLLHHEPINAATENPPTNSAEESQTYQCPVVQDPVNYGILQLNDGVCGEQTMLQTQRPQNILSIGETSGVFKEGTAHACKNDGSDMPRRDNLRSRTSRGGKANRGKEKSLMKGKSNGHQGREVGPVPMKKHVKQVISKTSFGLLHRRPQGKGAQHQSQLLPRGGKAKMSINYPLASDTRKDILRRREVHQNTTQPRLQYHAENGSAQLENGPSTVMEGSSAQLENRPPPDEFNFENNGQGPSSGINLQLNPDGFYSVHVAYDRCKTLAEGCGISEADVDEIIIEENDYLRQMNTVPDQNDRRDEDQGERVCTDPMTSDDEETETD